MGCSQEDKWDFLQKVLQYVCEKFVDKSSESYMRFINVSSAAVYFFKSL